MPPTQKDTSQDVRPAPKLTTQRESTPILNPAALLGSPVEIYRLPKNARSQRSTKGKRDGSHALKRLSTWLIKAASHAVSETLGYLSLITSSRGRKMATLRTCSATAIVGAVNDSEKKSENAACSVQIVIGDTLSFNKTITPILMSAMRCKEYMRPMESPTDEYAARFNTISEGIDRGSLDYSTVSMKEWMEVSFLMLYHGKESQLEQKMVYGGNLFQFHACINQITPNQQVSALGNKV